MIRSENRSSSSTLNCVVSANPSFYRAFATTPDDTVGHAFFALDEGQWDVADLQTTMARVVDEGRDFQDFVIDRSFARLGRRTLLLSGRHIHEWTPVPQGALLALDDITERTRAEDLSDALDETNLTMVSTLDYQEILDGALGKAVEALDADDAVLAVPEEASWVVSYALGRPARRLGSSVPDDGTQALATLKAEQTASPHGSTLRVTLRSRDAVLGVLSFGRARPKAPFGGAELDFVNKLAPALALALQNATLFSTESRVAHVLQASLLAPDFAFTGLEVGVAYRPAHQAERVGGDFYDLFALEDGLVVVVVGDVSGKGVEAASLTGTVRAVLRAFASIDPSPASLLARANELLLTQLPSGLFITVLLAVIDRASRKVTISSAGHPPALVCGGEKTRVLEITPGTPLGVMSSTYHDAHFDLAATEAMILFTDGLIEARHGKELFGEEGVAAMLASDGCDEIQGVVDRLVSAATEFAGGRLQDDVAVIAVRVAAGLT